MDYFGYGIQKIILIISFFMFVASTVYATQEVKDEIIYENQKCELQFDWSYPIY